MGLFVCLLSTSAAGQDLLDRKLSIVVYDDAHIGRKMLENSERLAGMILREAGIEPSWNVGPLEHPENLLVDFTAYSRNECEAETIPPILRLQILTHAPRGVAAQALGFSLPCAKRGVQATIYADRVAHVSETQAPTLPRALAYAIAHELGHVLLHSDRHADTGLMKGIWSKRDWQCAAVSLISFTPSECREIARFLQKDNRSQLAQLTSLQRH